MTENYLPVALDKRIAQARERVKYPAPGDSPWTIELLGYLADEAEAAQRHISEMDDTTPAGLSRKLDRLMRPGQHEGRKGVTR